MGEEASADIEAWAASGCMALTGRADAPPLGPPAGFVDAVHRLGTSIAERGGVELDVPALLGERAAIAGLARHGDRSCGGATRLLPVADGWVAVTLARDDDIDAVPAWLETDNGGDVWDVVAEEIAVRSADDLVERARLLGLPVAALERDAPAVTAATSARTNPKPVANTLVVDLSSLWAGPLCGHVLQLAGARVVKVESAARPDGARRGPRPFFDLINGGKQSVALDFDDAADVAALQKLIAIADVVIEGSRARALAQLGVHPRDAQVWLSITGYGRHSDGVGFGDDAAVAGGLVVWDGAGPCFCVDAVADPLTGLVAADLCLGALQSGTTGVADIPLAGVAARFAAPTVPVAGHPDVAAPKARTPTAAARDIGVDNEAVLAAL